MNESMIESRYFDKDDAFSLNRWINLPWWKLLPAMSERKFFKGYGILVFFPSLKRAYPKTSCASISFTQSGVKHSCQIESQSKDEKFHNYFLRVL